MNFQRISVEEAKFKFFNDDGLPVEGVKILDIRDEDSFKEGHINNARHIDNTNFMDFLQSTEFDEPIIIYCYHGITSQGVAAHVADQGFEDVYSLDGGYEAWIN